MSDYCEVNFKEIEAEKVFAFQKELKQNLLAHWQDVAKQNFSFCPFVQEMSCTIDSDNIPKKLTDIKEELLEKSKYWVYRLFSYRFFYDKEKKLLGVYGLPDTVKDMFDKQIVFQDATDQDYSRSAYEGVKEFEKIYDKWISLDINDFRSEYQKVFAQNNEELDDASVLSNDEMMYEKRSAAYKEIWSLYKNTFFDDNSAIYISMLSSWDISFIYRFLNFILSQI